MASDSALTGAHHLADTSVFEGIPLDAVLSILSGLERLRFEPGEPVIREGEHPGSVYIILEGFADVFATDRRGEERVIGRVRPGTMLGETTFLTDRPSAVTVRASTELEVVAVDDADFERIAARFPRIYRNLGAILAQRLARADRLAIDRMGAGLALLKDDGAPPEVAWALACSVAWHTQSSTLLLVLGELPEELGSLAAQADAPVPGRAAVRVIRSVDELPSGTIRAEVEDLFGTYDQILVLERGLEGGSLETARVVRLSETARTAQPDGADYVVRAWAEGRKPTGPEAGVVSVPRLVDADVELLRQGTLRPSSTAGRSLGWLARDISRRKVGVAFGAGSIRGYAHFGVMRVLERIGLQPDYISGTSIGSAVAGCAAVGIPADQGIEHFNHAAGVFRPTVPAYSILSSRGLKRFIHSIAGEALIEDLDTPLGIVAADLVSRREVVFRRGVLWQAVIASMAIPGVYPAQRIGPYVLVDGGILDPVPVDACVEMGADVVIAVHLGAPPGEREADAEAQLAAGRPLSAVSSIMRSIEIMQGHVAVDSSPFATIVLKPKIPDVHAKLRHFSQGQMFVGSGEEAAEEALPQLSAALPWLRA